MAQDSTTTCRTIPTARPPGPARAPHEGEMDMVVVKRVGAGRQHGRELLACRGVDVAQKTLFLGCPAPAVADGDGAAIGEREGRNVERVAERVLGNARGGLAG